MIENKIILEIFFHNFFNSLKKMEKKPLQISLKIFNQHTIILIKNAFGLNRN